jgi:thiamine-phosphate pyrophosphorylase
MNPPHLDVQATAHQLTQWHASLQAGKPKDLSSCWRNMPQDLSPVQQAVGLAALSLGFESDDAMLLGQAWQAQSQRTGHFDGKAWPTHRDDFGFAPKNPAQAFAACPQSLGLYAVVPDADWVARLVSLQVPTVQLRLKSSDRSAIDAQVRQAVRAVQGSATLLFINDHWEAALAHGAYGVHLGQEDMALAPLETLRLAGIRLGLSSHGYGEMKKAMAVQPSYLAMGAVFPTTLKAMATLPQGLGRLERYAQLMQGHSLVAIGGIDLQNLPAVMQTSVGSAAFVRAITGANDVTKAVADLKACISAYANQPRQ